MSTRPKFVQIFVPASQTVFALDESGRVWEYDWNRPGEWRALPDKRETTD